MRIIYLFFVLGMGLHAISQTNDAVVAKKIADDIMVNSTAYENLRYLCKKIGPRLSGSINAQKAVEATERMLREAGADTVYLQPCMVPHWVRGEKEKGYIQLANGTRRNLQLCALGLSEGTGKKGIIASVIEVRSFNELDQLGAKIIKGNIVFFNIPMNPTYIRTHNAYGESGIARWQGPARAASYGAVGAIVRSMASNPDGFPHTGSTYYNDSFPEIPAVAISTNDADWLSRQLKMKMSLKAYFRTTCSNLPDMLSYNVVGELKGNDWPEQIITVGGHLDSWDLGEGANDDGAGCVQGIEIIRVLKQLNIRSKRTVRAVMFMDEESQGRGAAKYLELAKLKNEQHVFALESDAGGFTPRGFIFDMKEEQRNKVSGWKGIFYPYGGYDFDGAGSGSDIGPLKEIGAALAAIEVDSQRYFDIHHAATDVFENVSRRELHLGAVNMAILVWLVSEYGL